MRVGGRAEVDRQRPLGPLAIWFRHVLVAIVYSHERSELRPSNRGDPTPRAQQRLLDRVLGVVDGAEHPVAVGVQLAAVGLDERP